MAREDPLDVMAVIVSSFLNFRCTLKFLQVLFQNFGFDSLDYMDTIQHLEDLQWGEESEGRLSLSPFGQAQAFVTRMRRPDLCEQTEAMIKRIQSFLMEGMPDWNY